MIGRAFLVTVLGACAFGASGCASGPAVIEAKTRQTVAVDLEAGRTNVTSKVAEELTLLLPPVEAGTGHQWVLALHDSRMLRQRSEIEPAANDGRPAIRFVAQRPVSRTLLRFLLLPATNGRAAEPADSRDVVVRIEP